jgi:hypothetical protein
MLATIKLDHDQALETYEVQNEIGERMLAAKLAPFELTSSQHSPKQALGVRRLVSQPTLKLRSENFLVGLSLHVWATSDTIPTQPSP